MIRNYKIVLKQGDVVTELCYRAHNKKEAKEKCKRYKDKYLKIVSINRIKE